MLLMPEIPILRPILSVFGIGPTGPIKGQLHISTAYWHSVYTVISRHTCYLGSKVLLWRGDPERQLVFPSTICCYESSPSFRNWEDDLGLYCLSPWRNSGSCLGEVAAVVNGCDHEKLLFHLPGPHFLSLRHVHLLISISDQEHRVSHHYHSQQRRTRLFHLSSIRH